MPIILDDIDSIIASTASQKATPKFFSKSITGNGSSAIGLLNINFNPLKAPTLAPDTDDISRKHTETAGAVKTQFIPFGLLTKSALKAGANAVTLPVPDTDTLFSLGSAQNVSVPTQMYVGLLPQGAIMREERGNGKEFIVQYRVDIYFVEDDNLERAVIVTNPSRAFNMPAYNRVLSSLSYDVADDIDKILSQVNISLTTKQRNDFMQYLVDYNVYDSISELAQAWAEDGIGEAMISYAEDIYAHASANGQTSPTNTQLQALAHLIRYLENYNVSLDCYTALYKCLHKLSDKATLDTLCNQNLSLLMSRVLDNLHQLSPQLTKLPQGNSSRLVPSHFSKQQVDVITSRDSLILCQAGAGTGKSTTTLERIQYMMGLGVKPEDIAVFSFTNAAADNITEKCANLGIFGVKSMTIARMINEIYNENYNHELSDTDILINTLDIRFPSQAMVLDFRRHLLEVRNNKGGAYTALNNFVKANFGAVIQILNSIGQTTLTLQLIIVYQLIDAVDAKGQPVLKEPAIANASYIIIDEVQDNSIFEFIWALKWTERHRSSLFLVGDSSQTLYEFRASNPKALNSLEKSGVFKTYQLTTNYRSNQEILDFANVALRDIDANKYAKIQLQANNLKKVTAASFKEAVNIHYTSQTKEKDLINNFDALMRINLKDYIDEKIAKGEKVAFLAYKRNHAVLAQQYFEKYYPNKTTVNLTSEKSFSSTVFTMFIKKFWTSVEQVNPTNATLTIAQMIPANLSVLVKNPATAGPHIQRMFNDWYLKNANTIKGWTVQIQNGTMTHDVFFENLKDSLIAYEIDHNQAKQALLNARNKENKEQNMKKNPDFIVSTIHGAKGLEFDNVIVFYKAESTMAEDFKRLYYVAFTRAMKSEFILAYGSNLHSNIESDYENLISEYEEREIIETLNDAGADEVTINEALENHRKNKAEAKKNARKKS